MSRTIEATTPQTSGSITYDFGSWSDAGAAAHMISTPSADTTYTATYSSRAGGVRRGISINFVGGGAAMGATESAGVVPKANWNNATGSTRSAPLALNDETGVASGATVTWSANSVSSTPITDQAGNRRLMKGHLNTSTTSVTTVTVAGLLPGPYVVHMYADGDNGSSTRRGAYAISGAGVTPASISLTDAGGANFNTAFTQANNSNGNFVKHTVTVTGTTPLTLTATPGTASSSTRRAPLNGVQIIPVTTPSSSAILINFQPASSAIPSGYLADTGLAYGNRGNGRTYGWNATITAQTRARGSSRSPDQRYDTFTFMQRSPYPDAVWEIAVPNGTYSVRAVAGDADNFDSVFRIAAEGVLTVSGTPTSAARWVEGTATVTVTDGRLTVRSASGGGNNKMCFIEITPQ